MTYPLVQLMVFLVIAGTDASVAIYGRYSGSGNDDSIGYAAHFFGALAGLLVGITVLRNLSVTRRERLLQRLAITIYLVLMIAAIIFNIFGGRFFPVQFVWNSERKKNDRSQSKYDLQNNISIPKDE